MYSQWFFTLLLVCVSLFTGQAAGGGFCTVAQVEQLYFAGQSIAVIQNTCQVLDVACSASEVFNMIDGGSTLADIYYQCQ